MEIFERPVHRQDRRYEVPGPWGRFEPLWEQPEQMTIEENNVRTQCYVLSDARFGSLFHALAADRNCRRRYSPRIARMTITMTLPSAEAYPNSPSPNARW